MPGLVIDRDVLIEAPVEVVWRTIVQINTAQGAAISAWLDGAANPLARVLDRLAPSEQAAFLKAMDLLEAELHVPDTKR